VAHTTLAVVFIFVQTMALQTRIKSIHGSLLDVRLPVIDRGVDCLRISTCALIRLIRLLITLVAFNVIDLRPPVLRRDYNDARIE
jgi:hypothetical protein